MSDLISRQAAIALAKDICVPTKDGTIYRHRCIDPGDIAELPSAKPVERTAKVISDDVIITVNGYMYHYEEYFCNACKKKVFSCDSYCSHCGAKLDWSWNE